MNIISSLFDFIADKIGNMLSAISTIQAAITAINNNLTGIVITDSFQLGNFEPASGTGTVYQTVDVSSHIPSGYKMIGVWGTGTGSYQYYFWECDIVDDTTVKVRLQMRSGTGSMAHPWVRLLLVRDL